MNNLERNIFEIKEELSSKLENAAFLLKNVPSGELRIKRHRGTIHYYSKTVKDGKVTYAYIRDCEKVFIRGLAEKAYYMKIKQLCMQDLEFIHSNKDRFVTDIESAAFDMLDEGSRIIVAEMNAEADAAILAWQNEIYNPNPYRPEHLVYPTLRGEKVRSKCERDIVDELYREGIPYKLEYPIEIGGETIYCDIVVLRLSDRSEIYWEHSGMLDKDHYIGTNYDRIAKYASIGILIGENLIITGETKDKPLSTKTINRIIDTYCR